MMMQYLSALLMVPTVESVSPPQIHQQNGSVTSQTALDWLMSLHCQRTPTKLFGLVGPSHPINTT
jgi:hypothetical protein